MRFGGRFPLSDDLAALLRAAMSRLAWDASLRAPAFRQADFEQLLQTAAQETLDIAGPEIARAERIACSEIARTFINGDLSTARTIALRIMVLRDDG